MHSIPWDDALRLGIPEMDDEHRILVQLMNQLMAAIHAPSPDEKAPDEKAIVTMARDLGLFTARHFQHEERSMEARHYPGYDAHKREHDHLLVQLDHVSDRLDNDGIAVIDDQLLEFLHGWVVNHIVNQDKAYAAYLKHGHRGF